VLSFGGSKLLTAGRGGALLSRHADVAQRARVLLHRGNHVCPLSELQAAVLLPQLDRLAEHNAHRRSQVALLGRLLDGVPGLGLFRNAVEDSAAAYYKVGLRFDAAAFGLERSRFVAAVRAEGVAVDEGFRALHVGRSPSRWRSGGPLTEAERAGAGAVVLHHPILLGGERDIEEVAAAVRKVHAHAALLAR
jgi:dTDP-4-amino-4,6-dideoxygalactose transaminase